MLQWLKDKLFILNGSLIIKIIANYRAITNNLLIIEAILNNEEEAGEKHLLTLEKSYVKQAKEKINELLFLTQTLREMNGQ